MLTEASVKLGLDVSVAVAMGINGFATGEILDTLGLNTSLSVCVSERASEWVSEIAKRFSLRSCIQLLINYISDQMTLMTTII